MPLPVIVKAEHVVHLNAVIPVHRKHHWCNKGVVASVLVDARPYRVDNQGNRQCWRGRGQEVASGALVGKGRRLYHRDVGTQEGRYTKGGALPTVNPTDMAGYAIQHSPSKARQSSNRIHVAADSTEIRTLYYPRSR